MPRLTCGPSRHTSMCRDAFTCWSDRRVGVAWRWTLVRPGARRRADTVAKRLAPCSSRDATPRRAQAGAARGQTRVPHQRPHTGSPAAGIEVVPTSRDVASNDGGPPGNGVSTGRSEGEHLAKNPGGFGTAGAGHAETILKGGAESLLEAGDADAGLTQGSGTDTGRHLLGGSNRGNCSRRGPTREILDEGGAIAGGGQASKELREATKRLVWAGEPAFDDARERGGCGADVPQARGAGAEEGGEVAEDLLELHAGSGRVRRRGCVWLRLHVHATTIRHGSPIM